MPPLERKEIMLALQHAHIGEIYPAIRCIVFDYNADTKSFLLRWYLDREVTDDDKESISVVVSLFISHFKFSDFDELKEECIYSIKPVRELDMLDGCIYLRRE